MIACIRAAGRAQKHAAARVVEVVESRLAGPDESVTCHLDSRGLVLMTVDRPKSYTDQFVGRARGMTAAYRGYVTEHDYGASALIDGLRFVDHRPVLEESPGGIYSAFVVDEAADRMVAWSSHGNMEAVFYAVGREFTVLGTNPMGVHVIAHPERDVAMSENWCRNVLVPGSTLYDDTPYENTLYVPSRRSVVSLPAEMRFEHHPVDLSGGASTGSVDTCIEESLRAVGVARWLPNPRVSLSGGKDSRTVLALAVKLGLRLPTYTEGVPEAGEVRTALAVANAAGAATEVVELPGFEWGDDAFWSAVRTKLHESDGLIHENRHLIHPIATHANDRVELHGQAHHLRGGYMTRARYPAFGDVRKATLARFSAGAPYCATDLADDVTTRIDEYFEHVPVAPHHLHLYWIYNDLRMARWLQAGFHQFRKRRLLIWPFLDERVLRVANNISIHDRAMEFAQYELIARCSPAIAPVPLFNDHWRFDQRGMGDTFYPDWHEARSQPIVDAVRIGTRQPAGSIESLLPYVRTALREFRAGPALLNSLSDLWRPVIDDDAPLDELVALQGRLPLYSFMWRIVAVASVYERL